MVLNMVDAKEKKRARYARHKRVRKKIRGCIERPRLVVYRSLKHIYAQLIDDDSGHILCSSSTLSKELRNKLKKTGNMSAAREVGILLAKKAKEKGIESVVFDRAGYKYHGRVKMLAEGAREGGLKF